jgi:hypothetical protein
MSPNLVTTRTGITIGGAYTPPPAQMGSEAERIQAALLAKRERSWNLAERCTYVIGVLAILFVIFTAAA